MATGGKKPKRSSTPTKRSVTKKFSITARPGDVLLLIDVINDLEFPGGENVLPWAEKMAAVLPGFKRKAHRAGIPVIYCNDNLGRWRSDFRGVFEYCIRAAARGRDTTRRLEPIAADYFVLKPRHSAFYCTALRPLLDELKAKRLILTGLATNLCVLFTAHDAHMHGYPMVVLSDCCAAESDFDHDVALTQLQQFCGAKVCLAEQIRFRTSA